MDDGRSLTERRRAATELEIASAAARLFAERGARAVTVEAIADAAGVAVRTFYRYFPAKEDAVGPLLAVGAGSWQDAVAAAEGDDLRTAIGDAIAEVLSPQDAQARAQLKRTRGLLRAVAADPALAAVWRRVNGDSEERLREVIAARRGPGADPFTTRLLAAAATGAIRVALEHWSTRGAARDDPAVLARGAFDRLSRGIVDADGS